MMMMMISSLKMILKEITQYNFHNFNCTSLQAYFDRCEEENASYHQSLKMEGIFVIE